MVVEVSEGEGTEGVGPKTYREMGRVHLGGVFDSLPPVFFLTLFFHFLVAIFILLLLLNSKEVFVCG